MAEAEQTLDEHRSAGQSPVFDKVLTVLVEVIGEKEMTTMELLREIKKECGRVEGCRRREGGKFEITLAREEGKLKLLDGLKIGNTSVMARDICRNEMTVSFLNLPVYIKDEEILNKLESWGVVTVSPIKRRMWPGTDVADGTRFLRVKFGEQVRSLPYSTKFDTAEGSEYFRVIHDRQERVCRLCIQPGHIVKDCPNFKCHRCGTQGHYARECSRCRTCGEDGTSCSCRKEAEVRVNQDGERRQEAPETERGVTEGGGQDQTKETEGGETTGGGQEPPREAEMEDDQEQSREQASELVESRQAEAAGEDSEDPGPSCQKDRGGEKDQGEGPGTIVDGGEDIGESSNKVGMDMGEGEGECDSGDTGDSVDDDDDDGNMEDIIKNRKRPRGRRESAKGKLKKNIKC